jgi:hypothetical protein
MEAHLVGYRESSINYSQYEKAKSRPNKADSPSVQSFKEIENTIMLNAKAMQQLKLIAAESNKHTYSDLIIYLIKHYKDTKANSSMLNVSTIEQEYII